MPSWNFKSISKQNPPAKRSIILCIIILCVYLLLAPAQGTTVGHVSCGSQETPNALITMLPDDVSFEDIVASSHASSTDACVALKNSARRMLNEGQWGFDTCTTNHVCTDESKFTELHEYHAELSGQKEGATSIINQAGTVLLHCDFGNESNFLELHDVLFQPDGTANLICPAKLARAHDLTFAADSNEIQLLHHGKQIGAAINVGDMYFLKTIPFDTCTSLSTMLEDHIRFGHPNETRLKQMYTMVDGVKANPSADMEFCSACAEGKLRRKNMPTSRTTPADFYEPGNFLHVDMWTFPRKTDILGGFKYFLLLSDDRTRYKWGFLVSNKTEVVRTIECKIT